MMFYFDEFGNPVGDNPTDVSDDGDDEAGTVVDSDAADEEKRQRRNDAICRLGVAAYTRPAEKAGVLQPDRFFSPEFYDFLESDGSADASERGESPGDVSSVDLATIIGDLGTPATTPTFDVGPDFTVTFGSGNESAGDLGFSGGSEGNGGGDLGGGFGGL